jgi:hypothetical protein
VKPVVISATIVTENPEHATRAAEAFARACTGLVLEGINVSLSMGYGDEDDDAGI